jgi:hypothetical protein
MNRGNFLKKALARSAGAMSGGALAKNLFAGEQGIVRPANVEPKDALPPSSRMADKQQNANPEKSEEDHAKAPEQIFPLRPNAAGRYLVDRNGRPFLIHGDTMWVWAWIGENGGMGKSAIETYLDDRRAKGFNALGFMAMYKEYDQQGRWHFFRDYEGNLPFTRELAPGIWDFASPNPAYFNTVKWLLDECAARNFLALVAPCWLGYPDTGAFQRDVVANGEKGCCAFGEYLGGLFGDGRNLVWIFGGDKVPTADEAATQHKVLEGIQKASAFPGALYCAHWRRNIEPNIPSLSRDVSSFAPDMTVEMFYPASLTYIGSLRAWHCGNYAGLTNPLPVLLGESYYEGQARFDIHGHGAKEPWPDYMCRRQAYWALLSGAAGHLYGVENNPLPPDLNLPGTRQMAYVKEFFTSRAWYNLIPDDTHQVVTEGYGVQATLDAAAANPPGSDYVAAGRTPDGGLVLAYIPPTGTTGRTITVNMTRLAGRTRVSWFNPFTGCYDALDVFPNVGLRRFTTPGDNGSGQNDWALVLETET